MLLREGAAFPLALAVQSRRGAPIGEVFTFASGLYFRGKVAYSARFARTPAGVHGAWVITAGRGLLPTHTPVNSEDLQDFGTVSIDVGCEAYRRPLLRDARRLNRALGREAEVVLLGSIASGKYTELLLEVFGSRLLFPDSFVGRGDMSRGGLMLRASRSGEELTYAPVRGAVVNGKRPPRLPRIPYRSESGTL